MTTSTSSDDGQIEQACLCQCSLVFVLPSQRAAAAEHARETGHHLRGRSAPICVVCAAPAEYECESAPPTCRVHKSTCCRQIGRAP
jgi:hypothetical protein